MKIQGEIEEFETLPNPSLLVCLQEAETSGESRQRFNQSSLRLVFMMPDIWMD